MKTIDWNQPQRQPLAGLAIVFLNTLWEALKRIWPFLLISLFGRKSNPKKAIGWTLVSLAVLALVVVGATLRWLYFRFYIEDGKLVVKSGWLRKQTKVIPLQRIQTVDIEQGPLHQLLNVVKLSIDTAGSQKAEAKIDALSRPMAEALRLALLSEKEEEKADVLPVQKPAPVIRLGMKDLLKLSLSANHLETFVLFVLFAFSLFDNLNDIDDQLLDGASDQLPASGNLYVALIFVTTIVLITVVISTMRIFFKFFDFTVTAAPKGFQVKGGLLNVKERLVATNKIQFVSWKQSWLRRLFGMWMLEHHVTGSNEFKRKLRVQIPITQPHFIHLLAQGYHSVPTVVQDDALRMHPSFIIRRLLVQGLLPSFILAASLWFVMSWYSLFFFLYTLPVWLLAWRLQHKFRLWALEDALYIRKGLFGEEHIVLQWHKLQSVQLKQSIYQRRTGLASLDVFTAAGTVNIHFIPVAAARALVNVALYKTEAEGRPWM